MDEDKLNISIHVGNVMHHITIKREEERLYREAERLVNTRLNHYAQDFPGHESAEYLPMLALDIALAFCRNKDRNDTEPLLKSMTTLTQEIEEKLK